MLTVSEKQLWDVFERGVGADAYRIPALVVTNAGTLLAFAEARREGLGDSGHIELVVRRSTDEGNTWSRTETVWSDGVNTCGNPAPVVDRETGRIWLPMTWNLGTDREKDIIEGRSQQPRRAYITYSDDDGQSWAPARALPEVRRPHWGWYATGPGNAIQLSRGKFAGRLVVPANHSDIQTDEEHFYRSHVFYSDDHGESWTLGGTVGPATNESVALELADGTLMLNMRSYAGANRRAVSLSNDGGISWSAPMLDDALVEPVCQASMSRDDFTEEDTRLSRVFFVNPASKQRERLTLKVSFTEGRSWESELLLYNGSSAYSSVVVLPGNEIGVLFERDAYQKISFVRVSASEIPNR